MKISLEWLSDFLPGPLEASAAAEALTHGGLPVELIETHGDDTVIDVEVTSNRADCLSHRGVARELSALLDRPFKSLFDSIAATAPGEAPTAVQVDVPNLCPHYTARVIRGVKIKPSPEWMQRRLEAIGLRPINNVVDVTNYVMFELGQPLHAFDLDKLEGQRIIVRNARANESITSIDGHARKLTPDMLVIADARKPVALAGVMGGRDSEVSDQTVSILLESARFDPLTVRSTARRLAMKSDSSYRFERGIDPALPLQASLRAAELIIETAGGQIVPGVAQAGGEMPPPRTVTMRLARLNHLLGVDIPPTAAMESLKRLHLAPALVGDEIRVAAPTWRADINIEADLIEEVARVIGYAKIPIRDQIQIRVVPPEPALKTTDLIRGLLVGGGYFEAVTVTFVSDALADAFKQAGLGLPRADAGVRKADARLRPSMLPGLLEAIARNQAGGVDGARLFEIGSTFALDQAGNIAEARRLGIAGAMDLRDVRGLVELLLSRLDSTRAVEVVPSKHAGFENGACGDIKWGGVLVGHLGRVDSAVCSKLDLRSAPAAAELDIEPLLAGAQVVPQLHPLPRFPAIRRDLSFIVADSLAYDSLRSLIDQTRPADLESLEYVGSYRGKPLASGTRSVTISLVFRSPTATLTSEAVDSSVASVVTAAEQKLGAVLRK